MVRKKRITASVWNRYKSIVNDFVDEDAGQQVLTWLRRIDQMLPYGEDSGDRYEPIMLKGLLQYNYIRTWPSLKETVSGELDGINIVLYVTKRNLQELGYINEQGYWNFNWVEDRFIINGKLYAPSGDTQVAQASDEPLLFFVVLKRETEEETLKIFRQLNNAHKYCELQQTVLDLTPNNQYSAENTVYTNCDFTVKGK